MTPTQRSKVLAALERGLTLAAAAAAAGVSAATLREERRKDPAYASNVEGARGRGMGTLEGVVLDAARGGDVKAAQWVLSRRVRAYQDTPAAQTTINAIVLDWSSPMAAGVLEDRAREAARKLPAVDIPGGVTAPLPPPGDVEDTQRK